LHLRANSNKTMLREARVLAALSGSSVPHPGFLAACEDTDVIGACFYLMEPIDGFTPRDQLPGRYGTDATWRRRMSEDLIAGAAGLAAVDPDAVGLSDFGKPDRWAERQVERWRSQLGSYAELPGYDRPELPGFERVAEWLDANVPSDHRIGVIHGDFQWANVMYAHDEPKLVALVDWELSTLGDPLLDLGWILTSWSEPGDPPGHELQVAPWSDFPTRAELIQQYGELTGRDMAVMPWFFVLACYKLGVILEGTWARALSGQAPMDIGQSLHDTALWLFAKAEQLVAGGG
jgi:aminoglycoside phosphotransferase (APT) family kinase protein